MAILNDNEFVEIEGRYYANPQVSLDESNAFIDNLRSTQQANNQKIQTDTYNLGTAVPSNLGGLTSPSGDAGLSYFTSRYQTPQTNAAVENLRAVAQANALNQVLQNEQEMWKKRYNDAYRRYQKSAYDKANSVSGGGGEEGVKRTNLGIDVNPNDKKNNYLNVNDTTGKTGQVIGVRGGLNIYRDKNGGIWTLRNLQGGDEVLLGGATNIGGNLVRNFPDGTPLSNGAVYNAGGGRVFMYVQDSRYPQGSFFRVGDSPTMSYK